MFDPSIFTSGASVPSVDPKDLRQVLRFSRDTIAQDQASGQTRAVGMSVFASMCTPGSDVAAVWWRCSLLQLAIQQGEFPRFQHDGEIDDALITLFATFPFRAVNIQPDGSFQLNREEFECELQKLGK